MARLRSVRVTATKNGSGRITNKLRPSVRSSIWIIATAMFVVVAFIALAVGNGMVLKPSNNDTNQNPASTLISRPVLPGESDTASTLGGASARCKDGTYSFKSGGEKVPDDDLCKTNGGVEQRLK